MSFFKQLDIEPFHSDFANCFEECMISVSNFYHRDYILMYSQAWGFWFDIDKYKLNGTGNSIKDDRGKVYDLYQLYHGIKISFDDNNNPQDVIKIIISHIMNGNPSGIFMDTFYYSWDPNKNQHGKHWFLITGFDTEKEVFYCTDPYFLQKDAILSFNDFISGYLGVLFTFEITNDEIFDYNWKELILNFSKKLNGESGGKNIFNSMEDFAASVEEGFCIEKETESIKRVIDMPYYVNLQSLNRGRVQYARFLEHTAAKYDVLELLPISEKLKKVSYKWDVLRGILTKAILTKNEAIIKSKIPPHIREISDIEKETFNLLIKTASGTSHINSNVFKKIDSVSKKPEKMNFNSYSYLDLSNYFNNKGFGALLDETGKSNLNGAGMFFVSDDISSDEIWEIDNMKFKFPKVLESRYDNVSCSGQEMEFSPVDCSNIMLLGTADFGSFKESIILRFIDGSTEEVNIGFTELVFAPLYGESVAWEGRACERLDGKIQVHNSKVKIFAKTYKLNKPGRVKGISLPYLPNMHIFAITLV
ncbi:hypothetical protein [Ruminiclostridium papyrosolvens]|uniref:Butirosin biosynthesis protein H N-terminal domain-containing protein n=1 Tax=Ruminiclostridium papyrosolvens C7 TaxID=1330534 RepID=U4R3U0_9FIRM|nr:hypothetical protein [Ruminiclostridium papyrosolvens]EPR12333.1 hypothetical protein L323_08450 [Ruminiclostridium papyrosolvens C7]